jgi:hypothetical protein
MACKKARSLSARRRTRHRDSCPATDGSPAPARCAVVAPWSQLSLGFVFFSFLLVSFFETAPLAAQSVAHASPLPSLVGARCAALVLYLIGFLSCRTRATGSVT